MQAQRRLWHCCCPCGPAPSVPPPSPPFSRLEEELRAKQAHEDELASRDKERRRKDKLASGKAKLSFAMDEVRVWGGSARPSK